MVWQNTKISSINKLLGVSLLISLAMHLLLMIFVYKFPLSSQELEKSGNDDSVAVKIVSPKDSANLLDNMRGQIVDLVDNLESRNPNKDTRYLSDKDRSVERDTQTSMTGINPNAPFTSMGRGENRNILSFQKPEGKQNDATAMSKKDSPRIVIGKNDKDPSSKSKPSNSLNLQPSQEELSKFYAVAPNNYLPDVEIGNSTLLNTRAFAYAGFFIRMKRQMEAIWDPQPILSRTSIERKPMYMTSLNIVLNSNGTLTSVEIDKSSGVRELDLEAIRTVKQSAPFPNPPKELFSPDQKIYIPSWNFIITYSRGLF